MRTIILFIFISMFFLSCDEEIAAPEYPSTHRSQIVSVDLNDVYGFSDKDIYAVGNSGTILHFNGVEWENLSSGITEDIRSVWGPQSDKVYLLTESDKIYQYTAEQWLELPDSKKSLFNFKKSWGVHGKFHPMLENELEYHLSVNYRNLYITDETDKIDTLFFFSSAYMYDVHGLSSSDIFICCSSGMVRHFDGKNWTDVPNDRIYNALYAIHGYDRNSLYAVGFGGTILYYDYTLDKWPQVDKITTEALNGVWVSASRTAYIVGNHGILVVMTR